ncbi:hypothetical protein FNF27_04267 [Cafeteria roenbergensis]|uniref:Suppressor of white apricot N-terminal domain-containing protein n=1 Tax=Cafeteria roenbergensis TaxID=33653 RepID=A0A5A8E921_CAFRO|nr:hypothetical protein FNF27_04267 [Cafeteria roenbergensis]
MAFGPSHAGWSRDEDVRDARRHLRDAIAEDRLSDAAARAVLCVYGTPLRLHRDAMLASGHNLGRDLVPLPGQHHARVSRFDVRLTMPAEALADAAGPDGNLELVVHDGRSSRRPGTNRYPFDPRSMRFRDMLNWERFRDAIVSEAAGVDELLRVRETALYLTSVATRDTRAPPAHPADGEADARDEDRAWAYGRSGASWGPDGRFSR